MLAGALLRLGGIERLRRNAHSGETSRRPPTSGSEQTPLPRTLVRSTQLQIGDTIRISNINLQNVRAFRDSGDIELGPITLLVGRNNSGKSTILRALSVMQAGSILPASLIRLGTDPGQLAVRFEDVQAGQLNGTLASAWVTANYAFDRAGNVTINGRAADGSHVGLNRFLDQSPSNYIYPYFSGRRVAGYSEQINEHAVRLVTNDLSTLAAKVDQLNDPRHPLHQKFEALVDEIVDLPLTALPSVNGKSVGIWAGPNDSISIDSMGDGVAQLLGLIVQLTISQNKLFLIEEIENDIHPQALKALLRAIESKANTNQFVISTHNNIVLRHLGAISSTKIYKVESGSELRNYADAGEGSLPLSTVESVEETMSARVELLTWLGYELSDSYLHDGWLILEESSAESVVSNLLIPEFAPRLAGVKTVSANGTGNVAKTFEALGRLALFTHLESRYLGRIRVIADGDSAGIEAISKLRAAFPTWPDEAFSTFPAHDFERYYPPRFQTTADAALALQDTAARRDAKRELLKTVLEWIEQDRSTAIAEFAASAAEVISILRAFEADLTS